MSEGLALDEIICDAQGRPYDLRYLEVNPAFERHTGLKAADILGHTTLELFPDAADDPVFEIYGKVALNGEPAHFEAQFGPLERWFEVNAYQTEPGRFATVFIDISERKEAEEDLRRRLEEIEALMDLVPAAVWVAHDPGCFEITGNQRANRFYEAMEGENVSAGPQPGKTVGPRRFLSDGRELHADELPMQRASARDEEVPTLSSCRAAERPAAHAVGSAVPLHGSDGQVRGSHRCLRGRE